MELDLTQHVNFPTMINSRSVNDLVFTQYEHSIMNIRPSMPLGSSDHISIIWEMEIEVAPKVKTLPRDNLNYWKGDYTSFNDAVNEIDWERELNSEDIDKNWTSFKEEVKTLTHTHRFVPLRRPPRKGRPQ